MVTPGSLITATTWSSSGEDNWPSLALSRISRHARWSATMLTTALAWCRGYFGGEALREPVPHFDRLRDFSKYLADDFAGSV